MNSRGGLLATCPRKGCPQSSVLRLPPAFSQQGCKLTRRASFQQADDTDDETEPERPIQQAGGDQEADTGEERAISVRRTALRRGLKDVQAPSVE